MFCCSEFNHFCLGLVHSLHFTSGNNCTYQTWYSSEARAMLFQAKEHPYQKELVLALFLQNLRLCFHFSLGETYLQNSFY